MNVKLCILLFTPVVYCGSFTSDINYIEQRTLPSSSDIAKKCFLKPICFYGYKSKFYTNNKINNTQIIFLNDDTLDNGGFLILEDLYKYLNRDDIILITNDDIYELNASEYFRNYWNIIFKKSNKNDVDTYIYNFYQKLDMYTHHIYGIKWYSHSNKLDFYLLLFISVFYTIFLIMRR